MITQSTCNHGWDFLLLAILLALVGFPAQERRDALRRDAAVRFARVNARRTAWSMRRQRAV